MNVSPANTALPGTAAAAASPPLRSLDSSSFIKLLTAELKNQDPTKPMDPTQMVSQLATISSVQQAVQTNTTLSSLLDVNSFLQAEQLVGKSIVAVDGNSGVVSSVALNSAGTTATLQDGSVVALRDVSKVSQ